MAASRESSLRSKASQAAAASAVFLINMTTGLGLGWSSPGWSKLLTPGEAPFLADVDEASWIVAMYDVGLPVGSIASGLLLNAVGRRRTLMLAPVLVLLASALTYLATGPVVLNVARAVQGVSFGLDLSCSSLYIGEIASRDMRGALCTFTSSMVFLGVLLQYCVGPYVSYWTQALLLVPAPLLSLLIFLFWAPESPYFLAARGRSEDVVRALRRVRGDDDVEKEAAEIRDAMEADERRRNRRWAWRAALNSPADRRACLIVLFLCGTGPMIGTGSLLSYAQYMFSATGSLSLSAAASSIVMCSVQVAAGFLSSQVIDRAGRRPLLMTSGLCNAAAMAAVGAFFFAKDALREDVTSIAWLPLAALMVFMVSTNLGTTTVPWVMIGELLPQRCKSFVPSLAVLGFSLVAFGTNKLFPVLGDRVGLYLPFWAFGVWSLLVVAFAYFLVPETRGRSLLQVQAILRARRDGLGGEEEPAKLTEKNLDDEEEEDDPSHTTSCVC